MGFSSGQMRAPYGMVLTFWSTLWPLPLWWLQSLKQLYNESQRDNQLLRNTLSKHEERKKNCTVDKHGKDLLILQLEEANGKVGVLDEELQMLQVRMFW